MLHIISVRIRTGYYQAAISNGQRIDAASAYITPIVGRGNLDILLNTRVTRIIQTDLVSGVPAFMKVEFGTNSSGGMRMSVYLIPLSTHYLYL